MPKFTLVEVEDFYTLYVQVSGVPEDIFWNADLSFINGIVRNKRAFGDYVNYARRKEMEKHSGHKKRS